MRNIGIVLKPRFILAGCDEDLEQPDMRKSYSEECSIFLYLIEEGTAVDEWVMGMGTLYKAADVEFTPELAVGTVPSRAT